MDESETENQRTLKALLAATSYHALRSAEGTTVVTFGGRFRSWAVRADVWNGWLTLNTFVMTVPACRATRMGLLEKALLANGDMPMTKLSLQGDKLNLEFECRDDVDAAGFERALGLFHAMAERAYPELFRIASGETAMAKLEGAFRRPTLDSHNTSESI